MYTKDQILTKIITDLADNSSGDISESVMREMLSWMADRQYLPSDIPVSIQGLLANNLQAALLELLTLSGKMTADNIVTALETLDVADCLNGAKVQYTGGVSMNNIVGKLDTRQNMNYDSEWPYGFGHVVVSSQIIYRSIQASNTGHAVTDTEWWQPIRTTMTAAEIAAALNANNTFAEMLKANRVQLEGTEFTVKLKFDSLDQAIVSLTSAIAAKQTQLSTKRITYASVANRIIEVAGVTKPIIQMLLNNVPYMGIESNDFSGGASAYDFIYKFATVDGPSVQIQLNPDLGFNFEPGNVIDLIY